MPNDHLESEYKDANRYTKKVSSDDFCCVRKNNFKKVFLLIYTTYIWNRSWQLNQYKTSKHIMFMFNDWSYESAHIETLLLVNRSNDVSVCML